MKKISWLIFGWVLSFHGNDYESIKILLDTLPYKYAKNAQIFPCQDEQGQWCTCVKYYNPDTKKGE